MQIKLKIQSILKDSLVSTISLVKEQMEKAMRQMELNLLLLLQLKRLSSQMIEVSNKLNQIFQLITLHANGLERFKLRNQENIHSSPNQMMDQNCGSMEISWLITGVFMVEDKEVVQLLYQLDIMISKQLISRTPEAPT